VLLVHACIMVCSALNKNVVKTLLLTSSFPPPSLPNCSLAEEYRLLVTPDNTATFRGEGMLVFDASAMAYDNTSSRDRWILFWCMLCVYICAKMAVKLNVLTHNDMFEVCREEYG